MGRRVQLGPSGDAFASKGSLHLSLILSIILYFVLDPISSLFSNSGNLTDKHARLSLLECARSITGDVKAENCGQRN